MNEGKAKIGFANLKAQYVHASVDGLLQESQPLCTIKERECAIVCERHGEKGKVGKIFL